MIVILITLVTVDKVNDSAGMDNGYRLKSAALSTNPLIMIRLPSL